LLSLRYQRTQRKIASQSPKPLITGMYMKMTRMDLRTMSAPRLLALLLFSVSSLCWGEQISGQTLGTTTITVDSTVANLLVNRPAPGSWKVVGDVGFKFEDGRTDTRGYSLALAATHVSSANVLWRTEAHWQRAEVRPQPTSPRFVIDDTRFLSLSGTRPVHERIGVMGMVSWRQDLPLKLDHRTMAQVGPAFTLAEGRTFAVATIPLIGVARQNNAGSPDAETVVHAGGVQTLLWRPIPTTTLQVYASGHRLLDNPDDYGYVINVSLTGALSRHLGMSFFYRAYEEGIRPPGVERVQHSLGAGLKVGFPSIAP
jgi:hypothetical protein